MATARDLCRKILEGAGVVGLGQPIEGALLADTLDYLNMELAFLNNQNAFAPYETVFTETLPSGQDIYTIGTGGDIALPRPISISWMKALLGDTWYTVEQTTQANFGQYTISNTTTTTPSVFYYESTYPLGTIGFATTLSTATDIKMSIRHEITAFGINDTVDLPSGYYPLLLWGTVARIPDIPEAKQAKARSNYMEMLATIKSQNTKTPRLTPNFRKRRNYDRDLDANI